MKQPCKPSVRQPLPHLRYWFPSLERPHKPLLRPVVDRVTCGLGAGTCVWTGSVWVWCVHSQLGYPSRRAEARARGKSLCRILPWNFVCPLRRTDTRSWSEQFSSFGQRRGLQGTGLYLPSLLDDTAAFARKSMSITEAAASVAARAFFYPSLAYNIARSRLQDTWNWWDEITEVCC